MEKKHGKNYMGSLDGFQKAKLLRHPPSHLSICATKTLKLNSAKIDLLIYRC